MSSIMSKRERIEENRELVSKCVECMIYHIKNEVPEKGKFRAQAFCYEDPVSNNPGSVWIEYDQLDPQNSRRLFVGARIGNSKYEVKSFIMKGSNSEIIEYLQQEGTIDEFTENILELDKEAEDKKGEYPFY